MKKWKWSILLFTIPFVSGCGKVWTSIESSTPSLSLINVTTLVTLSSSVVTQSGFTATATFQGDDNGNNSATIYYCNETTLPSCNPLTGASAAMVRASGQFTYSATSLTNSGTDTYNVEVVATDSDGVVNSPLTGTVTLTTAPTEIYRSVGPSNTSALASGSSNAMSISGRTATFASAIPNNVGVGDAVVYGSNADIAFISGRSSSTQYILQTANGGVPTAVTSDTSWSIYRAYTSLANAVDTNSGGTENTGLPSALRNFDTWSGGTDLVSAKKVWNVALYADAPDTTFTCICSILSDGYCNGSTGWTTSATYYLRIYTPYLSTEVGVGQRHSGTALSGYEYNPTTMDTDAIDINGVNFMTLEGLVITEASPGSDSFDLEIEEQSAGAVVNVDSNILMFTGTPTGTNQLLDAWTDNYGTVNIWNNIIYEPSAGTHSPGIDIEGSSTTAYAYNNTIVGTQYGLVSPGTLVAKNNIVQGATWSAYYGTFAAGSDYNISSDSTSTGGAHDQTNATVTFINSSADDYRLSPSDTVALDAAESLASDLYLVFATDIVDVSRPQGTAWDIGASEVLASTSHATEMLALTFSGVTSTSFTATATFQGDTNGDNSATIYYCDNTASSGCNPLSAGASAAMTRSSGQFSYTATSLTSGHTYNVDVVGSDSDGVYAPVLAESVSL